MTTQHWVTNQAGLPLTGELPRCRPFSDKPCQVPGETCTRLPHSHCSASWLVYAHTATRVIFSKWNLTLSPPQLVTQSNPSVAISLLRQTAVLNMPGDAYVTGILPVSAAASHILLQPQLPPNGSHAAHSPPLWGLCACCSFRSDHDHHPPSPN